MLRKNRGANPFARNLFAHEIVFQALRDAAFFVASEFGLNMHTVAAVPTWRGDRFATGWQVSFRDDASRLPAGDALTDLVSERTEREWNYLYGHADSDGDDDGAGARFTVEEVLHDPELAALSAKMAARR
jgi:hypothetical protein